LNWSGNCLRQIRTFILNPKNLKIKAKCFDLVLLLSERKQNVLIWSAYYRNESKRIWLAPKIISAIQYQKISIWAKNLKIVAKTTPRVVELGSWWLPTSVSRGVAVSMPERRIMSFYLCRKEESFIVVDLQYNGVWESQKGACIWAGKS
jgi:hypothetical protein